MLEPQLKERHLLFIVSFVFTGDCSSEYSLNSTVSLPNGFALKGGALHKVRMRLT